jgi:hypothetical protein
MMEGVLVMMMRGQINFLLQEFFFANELIVLQCCKTIFAAVALQSRSLT